MESCYGEGNHIDNIEDIIGKHDTILLYGAEPQYKIRDVSRSMSRILINSNTDASQKINDAINEIENTKKLNKKSVLEKIFVRKNGLLQSYKNIIHHMDKMSVDLQLQQAQIIKENKLLEEMESILNNCYDELGWYITNGEKIKIQVKNDNTVDGYWKERFNKRLQELRTSHTLLLQMQAQIQLLRKNNDQLVEQIVFVISGTIPIWRTQINMLMGLENSAYNNKINDKVVKMIEQSVKSKNKELKKKINNIDADQVEIVNSKLTKVLEELSLIEKKDRDIKNEVNNCLVL